MKGAGQSVHVVRVQTEGEMMGRLDALPADQQPGIRRFHDRVADYETSGLLSAEQARLVQEHVLRLGERGRNPANTGNLEDLFCYTLEDTEDPLRALAQLLADSVKIIPMDPNNALVPPLIERATGRRFERVGELQGYSPADVMLICHTMAAYGDPEMRALAERFIEVTEPGGTAETWARTFAQLALESQHSPSSTFVMARFRGLTIDVGPLYRAAGHPEDTVAAAERFYEICSEFDPDWVASFLGGTSPESPGWLSWRAEYLQLRKQLPEALAYQLSSDTLTNFLEGTLESGKWTDAAVMFNEAETVEDVPKALARIVNQYLAEHEALHGRPRTELVQKIRSPLGPWGVEFENGRARPATDDFLRIQDVARQFSAAVERRRLAMSDPQPE